ncbi:MAG: hypothetical protein CL946_03065 [Ectothiorhodospiraceae bacterium]|nr:hypothetical protein [Ectothiorhodospiraceae bacterium]
MTSFFVSDLHGKLPRYERLFTAIHEERPEVVFLGGDLMPGGTGRIGGRSKTAADFIDYLRLELARVRDLGVRVLSILGNDDGARIEGEVLAMQNEGLWEYIHMKPAAVGPYTIVGYNYVPPSPFQLKDWERYDVSRYTDIGSISPEEGMRTVPVDPLAVKYATISADLKELFGDASLQRTVVLFHSPPYQTKLDRAALDGKQVDHVPLDVHVGSIAIRRFIENCRPYLTLHGHIHESAQITGAWQDAIGDTVMLSAAHQGKELALVRFDLDRPQEAQRELIG